MTTVTWNTGKSKRRGGRGAVCGDTKDVRGVAAGGTMVVGAGGTDSLDAVVIVVVVPGRCPTGRTMSMKKSFGSDGGKYCEGRDDGVSCCF